MSDVSQARFIQIDEEGYLISEGLRINDEEYGRSLFENLYRDDRHRIWTKFDEVHALAESFDEPLIARSIQKSNDQWTITTPYGFSPQFQPETLSLDEWDRFHGRTQQDIPFVLSRPAQASFFDQLDEFDDDSITIDGRRIVLDPWLLPNAVVEGDPFWTKIYQTEVPRWDLRQPAPALVSVLPQLKLARQRVLVLGCGAGHDAAHLARQGHLVTGVDISPEAIKQANSLYGDIQNLKLITSDLFRLPSEMHQSFDLIFEHTCYCAVSPERRNELVHLWRKLLTPEGHLLGVFFAVDRRSGPPWGGSEWEVRERLKKYFDFRYWTRWRHSLPQRLGMEFVVFAQLTRR